jgi:hypothetical protein
MPQNLQDGHRLSFESNQGGAPAILIGRVRFTRFRSKTARNIGRNTGGLDELRPCNFRSRRIKVGQVAVTHAAECSSKFLIRGVEIGARKRMKAGISPLTDDTRGATASRDLKIDRQGTVVRDICKEGAIK